MGFLPGAERVYRAIGMAVAKKQAVKFLLRTYNRPAALSGIGTTYLFSGGING